MVPLKSAICFALEPKFFFGVFVGPIGVWHTYDLSANYPYSLRANLMFCVRCSQVTNYPPPNAENPSFPPPMCKKSKIFDNGQKLVVGSRDSMAKLAVFSTCRGSNRLAIYIDKKGVQLHRVWC